MKHLSSWKIRLNNKISVVSIIKIFYWWCEIVAVSREFINSIVNDMIDNEPEVLCIPYIIKEGVLCNETIWPDYCYNRL